MANPPTRESSAIQAIRRGAASDKRKPRGCVCDIHGPLIGFVCRLPDASREASPASTKSIKYGNSSRFSSTRLGYTYFLAITWVFSAPWAMEPAPGMASNSGVGKRLLNVREAAKYLGLQADTCSKKPLLPQL